MPQIPTLPTLRRLAGPRSFARGEEYYNRGLVRSLSEHEGTVTAKVMGTHTYTVKLRQTDDGLDHSCTCPMGDDGAFCKHCVAAGLAWIESADSGTGPKKRKGSPAEVTMKDVQGHLASLEKDTLIRMIMQRAQDDDHLREKLLMETAKTMRGGRNLAAMKRVLANAIDPGGFLDYHSMREYARNIDNVLDTVESMVKDGLATEVIELAEFAIDEVESAIQSVDDSNGEMSDILYRLHEMHLAACRKARPDPKQLAGMLFEKELNSEWEAFYGAAKTYASLLGAKGLAVYRDLAAAEWKKIKPLGPDKEDREERSHRRSNITHIMKTLAELSGDVEAMVEVRRKDLSSAYRYLDIAELYKKAGKHDQALDWAEAGKKAFSDRTDSRLREFLAEEYHRRKRHDDAMKLLWQNFAEHAVLETYKKLKNSADRAGHWPAWREKALAFIRADIAKAMQKRGSTYWAFGRDNSLLVEIFLWERKPEAAWREANEGGCSQQLWMKLAAGREKDHPADAIEVYRKWIDPIVSRKDNQAYEEAAALIRKVQGLMDRLKQGEAFTDYLLGVRVAHKQKRNFMKLLDRIK